MHKAMTSSQGISATEGPAPWRGERLLLLHLACVLWSRLSTWDWRTGRVWGPLGIWDAYWRTMAHTGSQGAGGEGARSYKVWPTRKWSRHKALLPVLTQRAAVGLSRLLLHPNEHTAVAEGRVCPESCCGDRASPRALTVPAPHPDRLHVRLRRLPGARHTHSTACGVPCSLWAPPVGRGWSLQTPHPEVQQAARGLFPTAHRTAALPGPRALPSGSQPSGLFPSGRRTASAREGWLGTQPRGVHTTAHGLQRHRRSRRARLSAKQEHWHDVSTEGGDPAEPVCGDRPARSPPRVPAGQDLLSIPKLQAWGSGLLGGGPSPGGCVDTQKL